ncbi:hypothetical protein J4E86_011700 [Alternaria arbusti]|uniref:uncharacterized protein n=1 Tax=Alternaria arbusti TaxID=232088 RepID=UPI002220DB96|nr:uncharacterized protein J4E86_011700 [Alternaria arbusti]KAI4929758.1 hypothetical protein J4E86_011700 [Alternaria arbusti]
MRSSPRRLLTRASKPSLHASHSLSISLSITIFILIASRIQNSIRQHILTMTMHNDINIWISLQYLTVDIAFCVSTNGTG